MDEKNDFQKLDNFVISSMRKDIPVIRIGFLMQLYLHNGFEPVIRHQVVDVIAQIAKTAGGNFSRFQKDGANRMSPIGTKDLAALFHAEVDRINPEIDFYGPHISDDLLPPRWQCDTLLLPKDESPRDVSPFRLAMPATLVKEATDDLIKNLINWIEQLKPLHGTAGLGLIYEIGMEDHFPNETWPMLSRFTGLDYMNNFTMAARGVNQIRCINWLTVLGTPILDEIGGIDRLDEMLTAAAQELGATEPEVAPRLYPYNGGVLIRAGQYPQLGDKNFTGIPVSYRIVNKVLRPWIFTDYQNYQTDLIRVPPPLDSYDETINWITRFDTED